MIPSGQPPMSVFGWAGEKINVVGGKSDGGKANMNHHLQSYPCQKINRVAEKTRLLQSHLTKDAETPTPTPPPKLG
jgi:hypothetical protein